MMSDKDRRKKDGEDTNKKNQAMRESVEERKAAGHPPDRRDDPNDRSHQWQNEKNDD